MKAWVILPAFNEAENLPALLEAIAATGVSLGIAYTILVVDDGSQDDTANVARRFGERLPLQLISHETNRGLARTIETGIRVALRGADEKDVVVTMDADNTHSPTLIPSMLREIERGADLVIASRFVAGGAEEGVPFMRRVLSRGVGVLMRARFSLQGVRDYSCGYRVYRVASLQAAVDAYGDRLIEAQGFTVMAELLVKMAPFCRGIVEVPLHLRYDLKRGGSKIRVLRTVVGYVRLLCSRRLRTA
jgi:dolichol-phosphate mannosyltransferase